MYRLLHVGFGFFGPPKIKELEPFFTGFGGDWVRYSSHCWLLWTDKSVADVYATLRPQLTSQDQLLISALKIEDSFGLLSPWIWTWIQTKRPDVPMATGVLADMILKNYLLASKK